MTISKSTKIKKNDLLQFNGFIVPALSAALGSHTMCFFLRIWCHVPVSYSIIIIIIDMNVHVPAICWSISLIIYMKKQSTEHQKEQPTGEK